MKPARVIFKGVPNKRIQKSLAAQVMKEKLNLHVSCQKGGSMNEQAMEEYLQDNFGLPDHEQNSELIDSSGMMHAKSMLVMDSHRAHLTNKIKQLCKKNRLIPAIIPGGYTPVLQPLDVGVNRSFKTKMRHKWTKWIWDAVKSKNSHAANIKPPSRIQLCRWVHESCNELSSRVISNSFRKVFIGRESSSGWRKI